MNCKSKILAIIFQGLVLITVASNASAHGEDKPGPHGGIIRMPSSFHTELVSVDEHSLQIYLLDIMFKEPVSQDSTVKAEVVDGTDHFLLNCKAKGKAFSCFVPTEKTLSRGELVVSATRSQVQGSDQRYALPLSLHTKSEKTHQ